MIRTVLGVIVYFLLTLGFGSGAWYLNDQIQVGAKKIADGQRQLAEGQQQLARGKARLAAGKRELSNAKNGYNTATAITTPFIFGLPVAGQGIAIVGDQVARGKLQSGERQVADGEMKVRNGEKQIAAGKLALQRGIEKLSLAKKIRLACVAFAALFGVLLLFCLIKAIVKKVSHAK